MAAMSGPAPSATPTSPTIHPDRTRSHAPQNRAHTVRIMTRLMLIRHAHPLVDPDVPAAQWPLSPEGREAAHALARRIDVEPDPVVATSDETKALETARIVADVTGGEVVVDARLREVSRPWTPGGYRALAKAWLAGHHLDGWESQATVSQRMAGAIDDIMGSADSTALVVGHGLAVTTFLAAVTDIEPVAFWTALRLPDAWWVDLREGRLERLEAD